MEMKIINVRGGYMINLRPYKRCDAGVVASWVKDEKEFHQWSAGLLGDYPANENTLLDYSEAIADDENCLQLVATAEGIPVGYLNMRIRGEANDVAHFGFVIVDPSKRNRGLGKSMIKMAINYAFDYLNVKKITLKVFEENSYAIKTYLSIGFHETSNRTPYLFQTEHWTAVLMELFSDKALAGESEDESAEDEVVKNIINDNRFVYAFQPIVSAKTGEIYGYEALMRAEHEGIPVSPLRILDYATEHDMLYDIEKMTLFNVLSNYIFEQGQLGERKVFINSIPGYQLNNKDYNELCAKYKKYFKNVVLEVTEHTQFKDNELDDLIDKSSRDGFQLAIDDYGTGYSNTSKLLEYLPSYLKIDRLLIAGINEDTKKQHFVRAIIEFAHANGFMALAEGVETSAELKSVIGLDVDLIQGYYTARPSFEIVDELESEIVNEIANTHVTNQTTETRKTYVVQNETELPLMRIALEQNSGLLISGEEFTLVGNTKYCAEMSVKIKDGSKTRLTIRDVFLESFMQLPCIELGQNVDLTLVLEGENKLRRLGIYVPESSNLTIEGEGNLTLRIQGINAYGIGNNHDSGFGNIHWAASGALDILVEADYGIGIGGGYSSGEGIKFTSGTVRIEPASRESLGIGAKEKSVPIIVENTLLQLDLKTDTGIGIGNGGEIQDTKILNSRVNIIGAGSCIAAIGSTEATDGQIDIEDSEVTIMSNGQSLYLIGAPEGNVDVVMNNSTINLRGEGNEVLAIGTKNMCGQIHSDKSLVNIKIASGIPHLFGAKEENIVFCGGLRSISVNE